MKFFVLLLVGCSIITVTKIVIREKIAKEVIEDLIETVAIIIAKIRK